MKKILLIVDPQNDFITGTLPVLGAKEKMMKLADYIQKKGIEYNIVNITLDSHPDNHSSFKENGGIWPKHCVMHTNGWGVPEYLDDALKELNQVSQNVIINIFTKGTLAEKEEYSIFDNEKDGVTLKNDIKRLIQSGEVYIDVCGIAGDYCVLETIKGLMDVIGNQYITILEPYIASIDGGEKLKTFATENNINCIEPNFK